MKTILIILMIIHVILFVVGVYQLFNGLLFCGLFNTTFNLIFFISNFKNLKTLD